MSTSIGRCRARSGAWFGGALYNARSPAQGVRCDSSHFVTHRFHAKKCYDLK
ncbi:hypothetical protein HMPREF0762_00738 [Slackia exigua ATCC 700122]|uniref:Uncharacterized protein n=1 Tax=Slackia exigua (strain ATCC 700122 / DSM 15923 / CIP 105133 / JCM 11022 / KCTC 5966 / S-7) TaxID=649764 RepID=D0WFY8_SLAES|nr:hypothetical protein HMPREF0762_00738 [Slackia exigua ATCC 700122]